MDHGDLVNASSNSLIANEHQVTSRLTNVSYSYYLCGGGFNEGHKHHAKVPWNVALGGGGAHHL